VSYVDVTEIRPHIALVTLNRPERLNAMSPTLVGDLHAAIAELARDNTIRVVVVTGAGRAFCAGLDLKELGTGPMSDGLRGPHASLRWQEYIADLVTQLRRLPQPVIAAVNGAAYGGGLALACAAEARVIADDARLCVQFINVGLSGCDIGISYTLPRWVGAGRAFELILTGREFSAAEAFAMGLANRVTPAADVVDTALELAEQMAGHTPLGLMLTKEALWANVDAPSLEAALHVENRNQILAGQTGDIGEAITAFNQKRAANFSS
jgi:enoyl-CoA hydratase/carnithine racemase